MAKKRTPRVIKGRFEFVGKGDGEDAPELAVSLVDESGKTLATVAVDDDVFEIEADVLKQASRVLIGPADAEPGTATRGTFRSFPAAHFAEIIERVPLAEMRWRPWLKWVRCVSGSVRHCFPKPWIIDVLVNRAGLSPLRAGLSPITGVVPEIRPFPWRCSPVCIGVVEVYRRICCCPDIDIFDPRLPEIIDVIEDPPVPFPFPEPDPPPFPLPEPGPDPAPWEDMDRVLSGGALDQRKILAGDVAALRTLPQKEQVAFLNTHRYLWCTCGAASKVGEGTIQDDGSFEVCWWEPIALHPTRCNEQYAYVVKQPRFGTLFTIYDGMAAGQWFDADDQPSLTSFSPFAVGCREPVVPGEGAFVVLQDIGDTESHRLATPTQDAVFAVSSAAYNSGLLDPVANPADAIGKHKNRNLGGTVRLRYEFTDGMHDLGAVYYRVSVAPANDAGDPTGSFQPAPAPQWKYWDISTGNDGTHSLGPVTKGGEGSLYVIPFDRVTPLDSTDEWHNGQYHAVLDTLAKPNGRYLVAVEVFDKDGNRLRPNGASGAGADKQFTFRRWLAPGSTTSVPFAALTHMLWWDNRKAVAQIVDIRKNGVASTSECQFLVGYGGETVSVGYRAYHPKVDVPQPGFILRHSLSLRRGLGGPSWNIADDHGLNVGGPGGAPPHLSLSKTFAELLAPPDDPITKCAFSLVLHTVSKTTNGEGHSSYFDATDQAAFAAEVVS